jgi:hypothetical protein
MVKIRWAFIVCDGAAAWRYLPYLFRQLKQTFI